MNILQYHCKTAAFKYLRLLAIDAIEYCILIETAAYNSNYQYLKQL